MDVVAEARSWIGTPFLHQGRTKQGVDCAGHVAGVALALNAIDASWKTKLDATYAHVPKVMPEVLQALESCMTEIPKAQAEPGDVLVIGWKSQAPHIGFMGAAYGQPTLIHALFGEGGKGVVEHRISDRWNRRIVAAYRLN
jgi:NlpC/P60 family putative phage cell wall peptidase